jgi:hypothetical protein
MTARVCTTRRAYRVAHLRGPGPARSMCGIALEGSYRAPDSVPTCERCVVAAPRMEQRLHAMRLDLAESDADCGSTP